MRRGIGATMASIMLALLGALAPSSALADGVSLTVTPTVNNYYGVPWLFDFTASGKAPSVECGVPGFPLRCFNYVEVRAVSPSASCQPDQGYLILFDGPTPGDFSKHVNMWAGVEGPNRFCAILSHTAPAGATPGSKVIDGTAYVDVPDAVGPPPGNVVNCNSFTSVAAMSTYFRYYPGDPGDLDGDNDGRPCEEGLSGIASANPSGLWQRFIPAPYVPPVPVATLAPTPVATPTPTVTPAPKAEPLTTLGLTETRSFAKRYLVERYASFSSRRLDQLACSRQTATRMRCVVRWHRNRSVWKGSLAVTRTASGLKASAVKINRRRS